MVLMRGVWVAQSRGSQRLRSIKTLQLYYHVHHCYYFFYYYHYHVTMSSCRQHVPRTAAVRPRTSLPHFWRMAALRVSLPQSTVCTAAA